MFIHQRKRKWTGCVMAGVVFEFWRSWPLLAGRSSVLGFWKTPWSPLVTWLWCTVSGNCFLSTGTYRLAKTAHRPDLLCLCFGCWSPVRSSLICTDRWGSSLIGRMHWRWIHLKRRTVRSSNQRRSLSIPCSSFFWWSQLEPCHRHCPKIRR